MKDYCLSSSSACALKTLTVSWDFLVDSEQTESICGWDVGGITGGGTLQRGV